MSVAYWIDFVAVDGLPGNVLSFFLSGLQSGHFTDDIRYCCCGGIESWRLSCIYSCSGAPRHPIHALEREPQTIEFGSGSCLGSFLIQGRAPACQPTVPSRRLQCCVLRSIPDLSEATGCGHFCLDSFVCGTRLRRKCLPSRHNPNLGLRDSNTRNRIHRALGPHNST